MAGWESMYIITDEVTANAVRSSSNSSSCIYMLEFQRGQ